MDMIDSSIDRLGPELIALRRRLHQQPELAFEERETSRLVAERLHQLGFEVKSNVGQTGVVGILDSHQPGPTILLRADMDALPIQTSLDVYYRSQRPDAMHACGHDGHTAIGLTVAEALTQHRDRLAGKVISIFQPAEETLEGAKAMLADNALEGVQVDKVLGLHLINDLPVGTVHIRPGPVMAGRDIFRMTIRGKSGHAAKPHQTVDAILIASMIVNHLQHVVSRERDPITTLVLSITSIHAGNGYNVVPNEVELKGGLRSFDLGVRESTIRRVNEIASGVASSMRGSCVTDWQQDVPPLVNDEAVARHVWQVAEKVVGQENVFQADQRMSSEDMALWLQQAPGCYFFVGTRNEAKGLDQPHHSAGFDIDEDALAIGAKVLARAAFGYLT